MFWKEWYCICCKWLHLVFLNRIWLLQWEDQFFKMFILGLWNFLHWKSKEFIHWFPPCLLMKRTLLLVTALCYSLLNMYGTFDRLCQHHPWSYCNPLWFVVSASVTCTACIIGKAIIDFYFFSMYGQKLWPFEAQRQIIQLCDLYLLEFPQGTISCSS
jgi:hypothetical protein